MRQKKKFGYFEATIVALAIIGLGYLIWFIATSWYHSGRVRAISGLTEPKQSDVTGSLEINKGGYNCHVTLKCSYDIDALVVHTKEYSGSSMADTISPLDLGLAWGKAAEYNEQIDFHWDQRNRKLLCEGITDYELKPFGGNLHAFLQCISNNHLIPAEKNVEKELMKIRTGDRVRIRGYLVNVDALDVSKNQGCYWYSSTSRDDEGDGACEIIYVTNVDIIEDE